MHKMFSSSSKMPQIPESVRSLLIPGQILTVVGLNDADIAYAREEITEYFRTGAAGSAPRIISILRTDSLFSHSSVQENIFLHRPKLFAPNYISNAQACRNLLERFDIRINPKKSVMALAEDERKLVEALRAYAQKPTVLFLYDTLSSLGYYYMTVFRKIISALLSENCIVVYLSTKWETALTIGDNISIVYRERFSEHNDSISELRADPRRLIALLSGIEPDRNAIPEYDVTSVALNSLYASSQSFIKNNEVEQSFRYMTRAICETLKALECHLYLRNEYGKIRTVSDTDTERSEHILTDDFLGLAFQNERAIRYIQLDPENTTEFFSADHSDVHFMILAPIVNDVAVLGILQLMFERNTVLSQKQMLTLKAFCSEVCIIVESSRLINQSLLLRESHHRIKNNLQNIIGMLYMQSLILQKKLKESLECDNPSFQRDLSDAFSNIIVRIKSISMIHDLLTNHSHGSSIIEIGELLRALVDFHAQDASVEMVLHSDQINIHYNHATTIAMILNELIINSKKHAFSGIEDKTISVECHLIADRIEFIVSDNGIGLPEDFDVSRSSGMGMSIVYSMTKSLYGTIEHCSRSGSVFTLSFPKQSVMSDMEF